MTVVGSSVYVVCELDGGVVGVRNYDIMFGHVITTRRGFRGLKLDLTRRI